MRVQRLCSDKGGEYAVRAFNDHCHCMQIWRKYAATNMSQQIGVSEHVGSALVATARSFLRENALATFYCGDMFVAATSVSNRGPHSALRILAP